VIKKLLIILLGVLAYSNIGFGYTPPEGTPLGDNVHPRIIFQPEGGSYSFGLKISTIRSRIENNATYKTRVQDYIDDMDVRYAATYVAKDGLNRSFDAMGFAFLYILDPAVMEASPYNMSLDYSKAQYGAKAISIVKDISTGQSSMVSIENYVSTWSDFNAYDYSGNETYGPKNIAIAIVGDWCNAELSQAEKESFIDGIKNAYDYRYPNSDYDLFSPGKHYGVLGNGLGVLAFYGDTLGESYTTQVQNLIDDVLYTGWLRGIIELNNLTMVSGSYDWQGALYNKITAKNLGIGTFLISSLLDNNYFEDMAFFRYLPYHRVFSVNPRAQSGQYYDLGTHDVGHKNMDIVGDHGKFFIELDPVSRALDMAGMTESAYIHKWYTDDSGFIGGTLTGNDRYGDLLFEIIYHDDDVTSQAPSVAGIAKSMNLGNGRYIMRSGFESSTDTVIVFNALKYHTPSGHTHKNAAAFEIYKYGDLTTRRTVSKDFTGTGDKSDTMWNLWYNTIAIDDGAELLGGYRASPFEYHDIDPDNVAWDTNGDNHVGIIIADDLNDTHFDYVDYDYSNMWADTVATYAEREFVYLRSEGGTNDEFIVVYDRIESANSTWPKYFLIQCPWEPVLLDSEDSPVTMGTGEYPGGDTAGIWTEAITSAFSVKLDNTYTDNNSHGRLFHKPVFPASVDLHKVNGPGHYWENIRGAEVAVADGDGSLSDLEKNYHGEYATWCQPATGNTYDNMLNVIQIGSTSTAESSTILTTMVDLVGIVGTTGSTGGIIGTHIKDTTKNRIILFNDQKRATQAVQAAPYEYTVTVTANSHHLLTNITANKTKFTSIFNAPNLLRIIFNVYVRTFRNDIIFFA